MCDENSKISIEIMNKRGQEIYDELKNVLDKKDKEIDRLNNENKQYKEYTKELKDSLKNYHIKNNKLINKNERLNNIILKIEQYLIDSGVDDEVLELCGIYDVNGVELRKYIEELKEGK